MQFTRLLQYCYIILCLSFGVLCFSNDVLTNEIPEASSALPGLEGRLVNGTKAFFGQFPHQVSLRRRGSNSHFCGGSIVGTQWVLTSANCMYRKNVKIDPWTISVAVIRITLYPVYSNLIHEVSDIIVHEDFERSTMTNDIALLKMAKPFEFYTPLMKIARLATEMPEPGTICQVSGWGALHENTPIVSNDLMYIELPLINRQRCRELLGLVTKLPSGMFCAGREEDLRDTCRGDSGSGMICNGALTGVVSDEESCARPTQPGFYADVPHYRDWLMQRMSDKSQTNGGDKSTHSTLDSSTVAYFNVAESTQDKGNTGSPVIHLSLSLTAIFAARALLSSLGVSTLYSL